MPSDEEFFNTPYETFYISLARSRCISRADGD